MRRQERLTPRRIPRTFKGHQEEVDRIVGAVRKVLDPLWELAEEEGQWANFPEHLEDNLCSVIESVTSSSGAVYLGHGSDRIAFIFANACVVKVSLDNAGCPATVSECNRWRHASNSEARHLLPTLAAHPKGLWSVMPYASEVGGG